MERRRHGVYPVKYKLADMLGEKTYPSLRHAPTACVRGANERLAELHCRSCSLLVMVNSTVSLSGRLRLSLGDDADAVRRKSENAF